MAAGPVEPREPTGGVVDGEQAVPEGGADVALHRGVGEVALEAALHERGAEHVEERVADLEVGLGVLEADRVDLVRHRRRADGALAADLGEVAHRDVGPHVGAQVVQHAVEPGDVGVELACQSWLSICVVSGFHVRPRCSTNSRLTDCQSAPGTAATCAP
jgi:hypothetical protein